MLTPEYFTTDKWARLLIIFYQLEDWIFQDTAKRLKAAGKKTGTTERELLKLSQYGRFSGDIEAKLAQVMNLSKKELKSILEASVIYSLREEAPIYHRLGVDIQRPLQNRRVREVLDAQWAKTNGELSNLTRTTMLQANKDLIELMNQADMRVASGLQSYDDAVSSVLDEYAGRGVVIDYPSGARRGIEGAVRACIVTSMNQTSAEITNAYIKEGGVEYVLTSAHIGARVGRPEDPPCADHMSWQGRVFKVRGSEPGIPNLLEATGYDIDDNGHGHVVDPRGLHGYNCRHGHKPWDPSLRNPYRNEKGELLDGNGDVITKEENRKAFELSQQQRRMERAIRKTKRQIVMKEAQGIDDQALKTKLTRQNKAYNDFCTQNGLQPQYSRSKVIGYQTY